MNYKRIEIDSLPYISQSYLISFIFENSEMDWNEVCKFVRKESILTEEKVFYNRADIFDETHEKYYKAEELKWIRAFFETYPEYDEVMFVFDD